jgi:drug/metabolite transporter (DMT)-like permease
LQKYFEMLHSHTGEFIALVTAFCWTSTALSFQKATKRVGSISVNVLRMLISLVIFIVVSSIVRGQMFPVDAPAHVWTWMTISGIVGFVFGDYMLFKSYEFVTARISTLVMALNPPMAAIISRFFLGETLSTKSIFAMFIVLTGIFLVIIERNDKNAQTMSKSKFNIKYNFKGVLYAFGGAVGQAMGIVISKYGMQDYNVLGATQIRIIAGSTGFVILVTLLKRWGQVRNTISDSKSMLFINIGAFFGPFLGVYLSLLAISYTKVGIASSIMSITPVLIIPPSILLLKEKVTAKEIFGAIIAVTGVILFFVGK